MSDGYSRRTVLRGVAGGASALARPTGARPHIFAPALEHPTT
jgi:hypothetical protein